MTKTASEPAPIENPEHTALATQIREGVAILVALGERQRRLRETVLVLIRAASEVGILSKVEREQLTRILSAADPPRKLLRELQRALLPSAAAKARAD